MNICRHDGKVVCSIKYSKFSMEGAQGGKEVHKVDG